MSIAVASTTRRTDFQVYDEWAFMVLSISGYNEVKTAIQEIHIKITENNNHRPLTLFLSFRPSFCLSISHAHNTLADIIHI